MLSRHRIVLSVGGVMLPALLVGCARSATTESTTTATPQPVATTEAATTTAAISTSTTAPSLQLDGAHVHVLGVWSGPEFDSFATVKTPWETDTGATVDWEGTQDLRAALNTDIRAGTPPDIAILPNPGLMHQLAEEGKLVPLDSVMDMNQVGKDYASPWIDLGSNNGRLYGIFYKLTSKATVWYNPKVFADSSYRVPKTWDDMIELADTMVADGHTPFSVVGPTGPGSGWALTDWISEIVLNSCGPDLYDKWIAGDIPWTDACIRQSFDMFDTIVQTEGYVLGGNQGIFGTTDAQGSYPMYTDPPTAYMYYLASFAQAFIATQYPGLRPGDDYDFFDFPTINPDYAGAVTIGADVLVMVNDTPAARSFMTYLAGSQAQQAWVRLGGFTSVNRGVSPDTYPDPVAQAVAEELADAKLSRFGAADMMPASLQTAWWSGMLDLVNDPGKLDSVLSSLTGVAANTR